MIREFRRYASPGRAERSPAHLAAFGRKLATILAPCHVGASTNPLPMRREARAVAPGPHERGAALHTTLETGARPPLGSWLQAGGDLGGRRRPPRTIRSAFAATLFSAIVAAPALGNDESAQEHADDASDVFVSPSLADRVRAKSTFSVAVFPMQNISLSPDVAWHFRQRVAHRLLDKGYVVIEGDWVDQALYKFGLTHAGQLSLVPLDKLGELVKADAFLFGLVEEATTQHAVAYNGYIYQSSLLLRDAEDGEILWHALEERISKRRFAIDPINAFLDVILVRAGSDSEKAAHVLADRLLVSLPHGPVQVVEGEDLLVRAKLVEPRQP